MNEIKDVNVNKKIDDKPTIKNSGKIANRLSEEFGAKNVKDFMETTNLQMKSTDLITRKSGETRAAGFVKELALLLLYQVVIDSNSIEYMNSFSNAFNDGEISEGNSKEYIVSLDTGFDTYDESKFIPSNITKPLQENTIISMFNADKTLNKDAYQFKKSLTITEMEWLPYFKSGELKKFIDLISGKMLRSYELFKFDMLAKLLTSLVPQKVIAGVEKDCFRCISNEVFPEIENMIKYNKDYNLLASSDYVDACNESDIMLVVGNKLLSRLKNGVESQLFNAQFFGPNSKPYNILTLSNKLTFGDSQTAITTDTSQYVDEDTIFAFDKNLIKSLIQVQKNESQSWAENMTIQLTLHVWGVVGTLPWNKIFKYTNANLKVLP